MIRRAVRHLATHDRPGVAHRAGWQGLWDKLVGTPNGRNGVAIIGAGEGTVGSPFDPVTWVLSGSRVVGEVAQHGACTAQSSVDLYAFHGTHPDGTVVEAVDVVTQIGADAAITGMANGSFDLRITGTLIITS